MEDWVIRFLGHDGEIHYFVSNATGIPLWSVEVSEARAFGKTQAVRMAQVLANMDIDVEIVARPCQKT